MRIKYYPQKNFMVVIVGEGIKIYAKKLPSDDAESTKP